MTSLRAVLLAVALPSALVLAGCSNDVGSSGNQGYVAGKGIITSVKAADRKQPGEVAGRTLDGKQVSLADFRGKVVVVNVWGSWCGPCRAEAPELEQAATALAPEGVQFLGIDVKDTKSAGADFLNSKQISYPSIYDPSMRTLLAIKGYPANGIPSTIVLDRQGRVAHIWLEAIDDPKGMIDVVSAIAAEQA